MLQEIEVLGQGGFAIVHKVLDTTANTYFALKTYKPNQAIPLTPEAYQHFSYRFKREAGAFQLINHPNVLKIINAELDCDPPRYLMPLANGTLRQNISSIRNLSLLDRIPVIMDILAGLESLHNLQMYHRDLKPDNILNYDQNYVISDLGLVSIRRDDFSQVTNTGVGLEGMYSAPEIVQSLRSVNAASDIYSIGAIIHDLTTSDSNLFRRVPYAEIRDNPSNPFSQIISICTRTDPNSRFQTVQDLRSAINTLISNINHQHLSNTSISTNIQDIIQELKQQSISKDTLDKLIPFLNAYTLNDDLRNIFTQLDKDNIFNIIKILDQNSLQNFANMYYKWIETGGFDFNFCDVLADRVSTFFQSENIGVQAFGLLALLKLGTSHNRWYVEHKFVSYLNSVSQDVLMRMLIEASVNKFAFIQAMRHLEFSIKTDLSKLPMPLISFINS